MNNLAMNAMKNTDKGEINITYGNMDRWHSLIISDTGKGMSQTLVDKLNDQEQMPSDYSTADGKKYRFGHLIIKDLLQLVNGRLIVESKPDEGTCVTIKFEEVNILN
jgi:signal transduction histidine kinase